MVLKMDNKSVKAFQKNSRLDSQEKLTHPLNSSYSLQTTPVLSEITSFRKYKSKTAIMVTYLLHKYKMIVLFPSYQLIMKLKYSYPIHHQELLVKFNSLLLFPLQV